MGKGRRRAENLGRPNIPLGSWAQRGTGAFSPTSGRGACCPLPAVASPSICSPFAPLLALCARVPPFQGGGGAGSQVIIASGLAGEVGVGAQKGGGRRGGARA